MFSVRPITKKNITSLKTACFFTDNIIIQYDYNLVQNGFTVFPEPAEQAIQEIKL